MATRMCDVCGVRPAVVEVRRRIPGEGQTVQYLCELHAAEARGGRPPLGASSLGGGSLFDDFFDRFFDEGRTAIPGGGNGTPEAGGAGGRDPVLLRRHHGAIAARPSRPSSGAASI
jgi:ATP-dependent Clp protease ATP-binding subunit ClpC